MTKIQTLINKDTALVALLDIKIKDITDKIMSKVSSLDIYYNYMVIIQAVYAKNITKNSQIGSW